MENVGPLHASLWAQVVPVPLGSHNTEPGSEGQDWPSRFYRAQPKKGVKGNLPTTSLLPNSHLVPKEPVFVDGSVFLNLPSPQQGLPPWLFGKHIDLIQGTPGSQHPTLLGVPRAAPGTGALWVALQLRSHSSV